MAERKNEAHDMVMESLTQALLQLMEKKPLSKINVSELCTRAGVGRVSFYRNFDSMDDILVQHLKKCTDEWWRDFSQKDVESFYTDFWPELLEQYRANGHLVRLLYENNASHLIKDHIFACAAPHLRSMRKSLMPEPRWRVRYTAWWMNGSSGEWAACRRISASGKLPI